MQKYRDVLDKMADIQEILYLSLRLEEIRLVALQPDQGTENIECMIETETFSTGSKDHDYEALSYTWDLLMNFEPYPLMAGLAMSEKISGGQLSSSPGGRGPTSLD
jgi:hypothetical protein